MNCSDENEYIVDAIWLFHILAARAVDIHPQGKQEIVRLHI